MYTLKAPLELDGTRRRPRRVDRRSTSWRSVEGDKLTAAADAAAALEHSGDALTNCRRQASGRRYGACRNAYRRRACRPRKQAQDDRARRAGPRCNAAQDSFDGKVDSVAADLGKSRDDVVGACVAGGRRRRRRRRRRAPREHRATTARRRSSRPRSTPCIRWSTTAARTSGTESDHRVRRGAADSRYWDGLAVGRRARGVRATGLIDKFRFADGQTVSLYDKYEDETREVAYEGDALHLGLRSLTWPCT